MSSGGSSGVGGKPPPQVPVNQDAGDDIVTADESFADDALAAKLKKREAQKKKAARDRRQAEAAKRLNQWKKVNEASSFSMDKEDARTLAREAKAKGTQEGLSAVEGDARSAGTGTLGKAEAQVQELMGQIDALLAQIDAAGGMEKVDELQGKEVAALEKGAADLLQLAGKLSAAQARVKELFKLLLAGGFGFRLLADPKLTFKRMFDRIARWPRRIPPGRRPSSGEEFDEFLAWIYEPPPLPLDEDLTAFED